MRLILSALVMTSLFIVSCAGAPETPEVVEEPLLYEEDIREKINALLDSEKPSDALQMIYYYRENGEHDLEGLETVALEDIGTRLSYSLDEREYVEAISYRKTLETLGSESDLKNIDEIKIEYLKNLMEFEKTGAAAALVSLSYVELAQLSLEDLEYLLEGFYQGENRKALQMTVDEMESRGIAAPIEMKDFVSGDVRMEHLLEGTVTVWVDKGLRIEKGVGLPDRNIGSGFFIDKKGYILTNYHVIESEVDPKYKGYSKLFIKLSDDRGEKIPAKVVGWDRHFDLALLKTEIEAPYVFSFAADEQFELGEEIFAIGSPGGLNNSINSGKVSALRRPLQTMADSIQIDVPINPGNSGGPLMNSDSEVNGVVFAGISQFEGVNFAIDGKYVKQLLPAMYEGGALRHSWLGIGGYQDYDKLECIYVMPGSPAANAGLKRGDKLLSLDGIAVARNQEMRDLLLAQAPGTLVELEWERDGVVKHSLISLAERPDIPLEEAVGKDARENLIPPLFGMVLSQVSKNQYSVQHVYTGGNADEASISANDVITLRKWVVNEKEGFVLMQFLFKGVKAGYLESAVQLGAGLESTIFF